MPADQIRKVWDVKLPPNLGIATGEPSGVFVFDIDPDSGGLDAVQKLQADYEPLDAGRVVRTGSGGWHLYFAMPDFDITNSPRGLKPYGKGIDIRGTGGQVVLPPSVSVKGAYSVLKDEPIGPAPEWLLDLLRPVTVSHEGPGGGALSTTPVATPAAPAEPRLLAYAERAWGGEVARLQQLAVTGWNGEPWDTTTYEVACNLFELAHASWTAYSERDVCEAVFVNAPRDPGFGDDRVNTKIESARLKTAGRARPQPALHDDMAAYVMGAMPAAPAAPNTVRAWPCRTWDDLGNSQRMVDRYGATMRWVEQAGTWAIYSGGAWRLDKARMAHDLAQKMIDSLPHTEAHSYSETNLVTVGKDQITEREAFLRWAKGQRMSARVAAALVELRGRSDMQAQTADFDTQPQLLNVRNGVIDLTTGRLQPHDPKLMLMQQAPVAYDPTAQAPEWSAFLERVQPNPSMRAYLQRISGYSITALTTEQALFIHHGAGSNGKSVYLQIVSEMLGDYGQAVPPATLLTRGRDQHPTDVARMAGKRFLQASETGVGQRLNEELVKGLTGGEMRTARFLNQDFFDFRPTGKIHLITNHLPELTDSPSIWRRVHLIRWGVIIPDAQQDIDLPYRIIANELPGVLAWFVAGAVAWARERLTPPQAALDDVAAYRAEQDEFGDFLATCCVIDEAISASVEQLYGAYQGWAFRNGMRHTIQGPTFSKMLTERGFRKISQGTWRGHGGLRPITVVEQQSVTL